MCGPAILLSTLLAGASVATSYMQSKSAAKAAQQAMPPIETYAPQALTETTYFRRSVTGACTAVSNVVTITVNPTLVPSITISATPN